MGNSVSLSTLPLIEFEGVNSFFGTRQAVKWLRMILPACICCIEAYKNNHPLLASEVILPKPLIHMKLCQWKSAIASVSVAETIWGHDTALVGEGFFLLVCTWGGRGWEEADAVRHGHQHATPDARSICLGCSPTPIPPSPPDHASRLAHMVCSEQQAWLVVLIWDNRPQWSRSRLPER